MSALAKTLLTLMLAGAFVSCATKPTQLQQWADKGDYNSLKNLQPFLYSSDPVLRQAAITGLLKIVKTSSDKHDVEDAVTALASATVSADPAVRGDTGAALLLNANEDLDFYSITLAADANPAVRRQIAQGLAAVGRAGPLRNTQRASIYLWGLTQDNDAEVRAAAAEGVGSLGLDDPIGFALDALRHDPEPRVRAAAARGLGALARSYLSGGRGPDWRDAQVEQFLNQLGSEAARTPTQVRGEEIVAALCTAAKSDQGTYSDMHYEGGLFSQKRFEETHSVAAVAAEALTIPGATPRADVAEAITTANVRVPTLPPPPSHRALPFRRPV